jgi:hypothetical protein
MGGFATVCFRTARQKTGHPGNGIHEGTTPAFERRLRHRLLYGATLQQCRECRPGHRDGVLDIAALRRFEWLAGINHRNHKRPATLLFYLSNAHLPKKG